MNKNRILIALLVCLIWPFLACEAEVSDSNSDTEKTKITATFSYTDTAITGERYESLEASPKWSAEGITATYAIDPQFPDGLGVNFGTTTGTISGTPKTTLPSTLYSVTATGSGKYTGTVTSEVTIEIVATIPYAGYYFNYTSTIITGIQNEAIEPLSLQWNSTTPDDLTATFVIEPQFPVGLGLDFDTATGTISGTPKTTLSSTAYDVTATFIRPYIGSYSTKEDSSEQINISITKPITGSFSYANPSIVTKTNTAITAIEPTWQDRTDDSQTIRYSSTPNLPTGISIDITTGEIRGTPTEVPDANNKAYTITATGIGLYSSTKTTQINLTIDCNNSGGADAFCYPYIVSGTDGTSSPIFAGTKPIGISYSIAVTGTGTVTPTLPNINASTGVVSVNSSTTAGSYKVSITGAPVSYSGNTETDFYVTVKLSGSYTTLPEAVNTGQSYFGNTADYNYIQTGEIISMANWFNGNRSFNGDISLWNVANVTDMSNMFRHAIFNGDISSWDVSNVVNMREMFSYTINFNNDIKDWDVSNVTNMNEMFKRAKSFAGTAGLNWNVAKVTDMGEMFGYATVFDGDISGWNVSNVANMREMFYEANKFNSIIKDWDISNVTNMSNMFYKATSFVQNIDDWHSKLNPALDKSNMFANSGLANNVPCWYASGDNNVC